MPIFQLDERIIFPDPELADDRTGIVAIGGDLSQERLLLAYSMGIFPWYSEDAPILWHSPRFRTLLDAGRIHVGRSLRKRMRKKPYRLTMDTAFRDVIRACANVPRAEQDGTWIVPEMVEAYVELHRAGYAHSVEAWQGDNLVGGVYGVSMGAAFFGESMFATASDASKIAFAKLCKQLTVWGIGLVDCQVHTDHLERFGAYQVHRKVFLDKLAEAMATSSRVGRWRFDDESLESD